tara:strand:- start:123 stop:668 length:546 start_codon:yes stop_codon:yes gene_type:complete
MATYPNFTQALQDFGKVQVSDAKAGVPDTALATSIEYQVQGAGRFQPTVLFTMNDYGGFVDTGVVGTRNQRTQLNSKRANDLFGFDKQPAFTGAYKMINPSAIDKWVVKKGLGGTRDAKGRFIKRSSIKFAVATSIYRKGLQGTGFFSTPLESNMEAFTPIFQDALAKDLTENLNIDKYFV